MSEPTAYDQLAALMAPGVELPDDWSPLPPRPTWMAQAACMDLPEGTTGASFFPDPRASAARALAICEGCPVRAPCLTFALDNDELGIWGGTSERQRAALRRLPKASQVDATALLDGLAVAQ